MKTQITVVLAATLLAACASTPDVTYRYYPAKSNSTVAITQTIDCNVDKSALVFVYAATVTTSYSADYSAGAGGPFTIAIHKLDGTFADNDLAVTLFDDGRLKSINATSTGQGEAILKSAISVASGALALAGGGPGGGKANAITGAHLKKCDVIKTWGGEKAVTVTYGANLSALPTLTPKAPGVSPASGALYNDLTADGPLPLIQVYLENPTDIQPAGSYTTTQAGTPSGIVDLTLRKTATQVVEVLVDGNEIWRGPIVVPGSSTFALPIPKPALFGKQNFSLTLSEAGAITAIDYGKTTGAGSVLNIGTAIEAAATPGTTAANAAEVKAQADLIAQQQRLARCQAQPDKCQ